MANFPIKGEILDLTPRPKASVRSYINFWSFDPPGCAVEPGYAHQDIHGRHAPYRFYTSTGPEIWDFVIHLYASIEEGDTRTAQDVYRDHLWIKALAFPDYGDDKKGPVRPPHVVRIAWGASITLTGVIQRPRFVWVPPYDENGYPHGIDVSFSFEVDQQTIPFDQSDIHAAARMVGLYSRVDD